MTKTSCVILVWYVGSFNKLKQKNDRIIFNDVGRSDHKDMWWLRTVLFWVSAESSVTSLLTFQDSPSVPSARFSWIIDP